MMQSHEVSEQMIQKLHKECKKKTTQNLVDTSVICQKWMYNYMLFLFIWVLE